MRSSLMMHSDLPLSPLATTLLQSVTCNAARALELPAGCLEKGRYADMIVVNLPQPCNVADLPVQLILHTHQTSMIFINGETYA